MRFDHRAVGQAIRIHRKELGISQEILSGLAGIGRTHLTMIENGNKQPNLETIWKIASALNILPSELIKTIEEILVNSTIDTAVNAESQNKSD